MLRFFAFHHQEQVQQKPGVGRGLVMDAVYQELAFGFRDIIIDALAAGIGWPATQSQVS